MVIFYFESVSKEVSLQYNHSATWTCENIIMKLKYNIIFIAKKQRKKDEQQKTAGFIGRSFDLKENYFLQSLYCVFH